jgi:hypothetical protein
MSRPLQQIPREDLAELGGKSTLAMDHDFGILDQVDTLPLVFPEGDKNIVKSIISRTTMEFLPLDLYLFLLHFTLNKNIYMSFINK